MDRTTSKGQARDTYRPAAAPAYYIATNGAVKMFYNNGLAKPQDFSRWATPSEIQKRRSEKPVSVPVSLKESNDIKSRDTFITPGGASFPAAPQERPATPFLDKFFGAVNKFLNGRQ